MEAARKGFKAHRGRNWRRLTLPKRKVKMNWAILPGTSES
jgi:hypothetical protein